MIGVQTHAISKEPLQSYFGFEMDSELSHTTGTGILINARGDVLTTGHVVEECSTVRVENDGSTKLIANDKPET